MLIEFLYKNLKFTIFRFLVPCYVCNALIFISMALINEQLRSTYTIDIQTKFVHGSADSQSWKSILMILVYANLLFVLIQFAINIKMLRMMGAINYFQKLWPYVDLSIMILSFWIFIQLMVHFSDVDDSGIYKANYDEYMVNTTRLRIAIMIGQFLIISKSQQYLTLIDSIAPLINTAFQIFNEIGGFLVILGIFMFSFSFAFYILSHNQINFDNLTSEEIDTINYDTTLGSINYILNMLIGETDMDAFSVGDGRMSILLQIVFWVACFIILIHLLNMLIAIMGNTFSVGNESLEQQKYKQHLRFVVDNWFMRRFAFENIRSVKYIIAAFSACEDDNHDPLVEEIKDEIVNKTADIQIQLLG